MKKNYNFLILLGMTVLILVGCKKDYLDINKDPNNPSEVAPELVLPAAQASAAVVIGGELFNVATFWSQYFTQSPVASQYKKEDDYSISTDYLDRVWGEAYAGGLNDLKNVRENGNTGYKLVGAALQGYIYQVLVDAVDKIPYSEALKGLDGVFQPKFDKGEDVYLGIIADLNQALATYDENPEPIVNGTDLIFGGDMNNWIRFINTLKLKMYMRMSNTSIADEAAMIALIAEGNFLNVDAKFSSFEGELGKENPFYAINVSSQLDNTNHVASQTLLVYLLENNDPRVSTVYKLAKNQPNFQGGVQGDYLNPEPKLIDKLARLNFSSTTPVYFFTKYEISFLLAEAAVRFGTGDGKSLYERGIDQNFELRGLSGASDFYVDEAVYAFPTEGEEAQLKAIYMQKWVSMAMFQNYESWTEIRRTGVPAFVEGTTTVPGSLLISVNSKLPKGQTPNRFFYPDIAASRNSNTPGQPTFLSEKVWWAK